MTYHRRKFRNQPIVVDGVRFDSKGEARRWAELQLLERAGEIRGLERQKRIKLTVEGVHICTWVVDFAYFEGQRRVWEDFKNPVTAKHPVYRIKRKLAQAIYPAVEIREVF